MRCAQCVDRFIALGLFICCTAISCLKAVPQHLLQRPNDQQLIRSPGDMFRPNFQLSSHVYIHTQRYSVIYNISLCLRRGIQKLYECCDTCVTAECFAKSIANLHITNYTNKFCMGLKFGLPHRGRNIGRGCSRKGC